MDHIANPPIENSVVNLETAKILAELGFDLDCPNIYPGEDKGYYAPTIEVTLEWLRTQNYIVEIIWGNIVQQYGYKIKNAEGKLLSDCYWYNKYSHAFDSAINTVLELKNNNNDLSEI